MGQSESRGSVEIHDSFKSLSGSSVTIGDSYSSRHEGPAKITVGKCVLLPDESTDTYWLNGQNTTVPVESTNHAIRVRGGVLSIGGHPSFERCLE